MVGYALVLSIGRDALPGDEERYRPPARTALRRPARLEPVPGIRDQLEPPSGLSAVAAPRPVRIRLEGASPAQSAAGAGVASFHTETGGDFRWYPIATATAAADGALEVETAARAGTSLTISFAASRAQARHGYIARAQVEAGATAAATLRGDVHRVRFDLPASVEQAGPLLLQRQDDRQWLPMSHSTAGLRLRKGTQLYLELGAGDYELLDPLSPQTAQTFSVPATDVVVVSSELAAAAGDRR